MADLFSFFTDVGNLVASLWNLVLGVVTFIWMLITEVFPKALYVIGMTFSFFITVVVLIVNIIIFCFSHLAFFFLLGQAYILIEGIKQKELSERVSKVINLEVAFFTTVVKGAILIVMGAQWIFTMSYKVLIDFIGRIIP